MMVDWTEVLSDEEIFWHRIHNLETALKNAKDKSFKKMWKSKLKKLMLKSENVSHQIKELSKWSIDFIPRNRTLH